MERSSARRTTSRTDHPEYAQVLYPSGVRAFLITAEPAHDAIGATVPTAFSVEGNVLTMTVDLSSPSIVYPVRAGQGWDGGYRVPTIIDFPEDEREIWEREQREREEAREALEAQAEGEYEGGPEPPNELPPPPYTKHQAESLLLFGKLNEDIAPPPAPPARPLPKGAHVTILYRSKCGGRCAWFKARVYNAAIITGAGNEWSEWEDGTQVHADIISGRITGLLPSWVPGNSYEVIFQGTTWNCGWLGPHYVHKGSGEHLLAYAHFTEEIWWVPHTEEGSAPVETNWGFQAWVYPNSFQAKHVNKNWGGQPSSLQCPTTISY